MSLRSPATVSYGALRAAGLVVPAAHRLVALFRISIAGSILCTIYALINISTGVTVFLAQNTLLTIFFGATAGFLLRGQPRNAIDFGLLPVIVITFAAQIAHLFLDAVLLSHLLYLPLLFIIAVQFAALFACRLYQVLIPIVLSALAAAAICLRYWDALAQNAAAGSGIVVAYLVIVLLSLTTYLETRRADREVALRESMIREVHHRVKNEAIMLLGLIDYEILEAESEETKEALQRDRQRLVAVLSTHRHLIAPSENRLISLDAYLQEIISPVENDLRRDNGRRLVDYRPSEVELSSADAVSVGIIINELLFNAVKYGTDDPDAKIVVHVEPLEKKGLLVRLENRRTSGVGAGRVEPASGGFGLAFVGQLATTMGGRMNIDSGDPSSFSV
ncbi:MAG: sensor histidine kinase, partial [Spirochaetota bacterium]